jgi:hypothetical protein
MSLSPSYVEKLARLGVLKSTAIGAGVGALGGGLFGAAVPLPDDRNEPATLNDRWRSAKLWGGYGAGLGAAAGLYRGAGNAFRESAARKATERAAREAAEDARWAEEAKERARRWAEDFSSRWGSEDFGRGAAGTGGSARASEDPYDFYTRWRQKQKSRRAAGAAKVRPSGSFPDWMGEVKTKAEAKAKHRQMAMKVHPDVTGGDHTRMAEVNNQMDVLMNSELWDKLAFAAFADELTKMADLTGLVLSQLARSQVAPPVSKAIEDMEGSIAEKWRRFSTQDPLGY